MLYGESLVFSISQIAISCLRQDAALNYVGFSPPYRVPGFPDDADRILAEPSNNSNLRTGRQLFALIFGLFLPFSLRF